MANHLILASRSPRRQELLKQVGIPFIVKTADVDEAEVDINNPVEKVKKLASLKAKHIPLGKEEVVLAADTVVTYKDEIFEKPHDKDEACRMISALSGEVHDVYTGVMIRSLQEEKVFVERTEVEFWSLTNEEIKWYLESKEPYDKAGAYGIQSLGAVLVKGIRGDYYNVVGLPLSRVVRELHHFSIYPKMPDSN